MNGHLFAGKHIRSKAAANRGRRGCRPVFRADGDRGRDDGPFWEGVEEGASHGEDGGGRVCPDDGLPEGEAVLRGDYDEVVPMHRQRRGAVRC